MTRKPEPIDATFIEPPPKPGMFEAPGELWVCVVTWLCLTAAFAMVGTVLFFAWRMM